MIFEEPLMRLPYHFNKGIKGLNFKREYYLARKLRHTRPAN